MTIAVLNGPNLNRLGQRETSVYGASSLRDLEADLRSAFADISLRFFQSNHEGQLIDHLHEAQDSGVRGVVFNPGAFTHTSVALRDAVASIAIPVVEVHISNIYAREEFRHHSLLAPVCAGQISGLGLAGYRMAIAFLAERLV